eukprot:4125863-Prymnesium_polylepis.1
MSAQPMVQYWHVFPAGSATWTVSKPALTVPGAPEPTTPPARTAEQQDSVPTLSNVGRAQRPGG